MRFTIQWILLAVLISAIGGKIYAQESLLPLEALLDQSELALDSNDLANAQIFISAAVGLITDEMIEACSSLEQIKPMLEEASTVTEIVDAKTLLQAARAEMETCNLAETAPLAAVESDEPPISATGLVMDEIVVVSPDFAFRYPSSSVWRPAEGLEGVLGRGSVLVADGYGLPIPRIEVFFSRTDASLTALAEDAVLDWSARTMLFGTVILNSEILETGNGQSIGFVRAVVDPVTLIISTIEIEPGVIAVFRYSANTDQYNSMAEDLPFEAFGAMVVSVTSEVPPEALTTLPEENLIPTSEIRTIAIGETVNAEMQSSESTDTWRFEGVAGQLVTITMVSDAIDTKLELYGSDNEYLDANDDFEGTNSQIGPYELPSSGEYIIYASNYDPTIGGEYSLQVSESNLAPVVNNPPAIESHTITIGQTVTANLERLTSDSWIFEGNIGTPIVIKMTSADFDSYLELRTSTGELITSNDDYDASNSQIGPAFLGAIDTYTIIAGSYESLGAGEYILELQEGTLEELGNVDSASSDSAITEAEVTPFPVQNTAPTVSCTVTAINNANERDAPNFEGNKVEILRSGRSMSAIAQFTDGQQWTWWQLENQLWVREDGVTEQGECDLLPLPGQVTSTTPSSGVSTVNCPGFNLSSQLKIGDLGEVLPGDDNLINSKAGRLSVDSSIQRLGRIPPGGVFTVLDGPICNHEILWWLVDYQGIIGWTGEGTENSYWVKLISQQTPPSTVMPTISGPSDEQPSSSTTATQTPIASPSTDITAPNSDVNTLYIDFSQESDLYEPIGTRRGDGLYTAAYSYENNMVKLEFPAIHIKGDFVIDYSFELVEARLGTRIGLEVYSQYSASPLADLATVFFLDENIAAAYNNSVGLSEYADLSINDELQWQPNQPYKFSVSARDNVITMILNDRQMIQFNRDDLVFDGNFNIVLTEADIISTSLSVQPIGWEFDSFESIEAITTLSNGIMLSESLPNGSTREFTYNGNANELVSFQLLESTEPGIIIELYLPNGELLAAGRGGSFSGEAGSIENILLFEAGQYRVVIVNTNEESVFRGINSGEFSLSVQLIQEGVQAGVISSEDVFALNGSFLQALDRFIYSDSNKLSFLYSPNVKLANHPTHPWIILSPTETTLSQALEANQILTNPTDGLLYIWLIKASELLTETTPSSLAIQIQEEYLPNFQPEGEPRLAPIADQDYIVYRLDHAAISVLPFADGDYAIELNIFSNGGESFSLSEDTLGSASNSGLPYFSPRQRAVLGLPQERIDAPTLDISIPLEQTYETDFFTVSYPNEDWAISDHVPQNLPEDLIQNSIGLPLSLLYTPTPEISVQVSFFVRPTGGLLDAGAWLDVINLAGLALFGADIEYTIEQVYVHNNLITVIQTTSELSGQMIRLEVLLSNGETVTLLAAGEAVDVIDIDVLLAIAGSLQP